MSQDDELKREEIVIRGLLRLPAEMKGDFARLHQDEDDFLRRTDYRGTGLPENGLSVFRKCKFDSSEEFYSRLGTKKACGLTESPLGALLDKGLKYKVTGEKQEHISLRCPDCDMVDLESGICKPTSGASFADCPFFDKADPLDLNGAFKEVEAPAFRTGKKKA